MYFLLLIILFSDVVQYTESFFHSFLNHKNHVAKQIYAMPPFYEKTSWELIGKTMKSNARNWFLKRAEQRGINWNVTSNYYMENLNKLRYWKVKVTNMSLDYPSYYIKPFHGYDQGNMNWQAAYEGEAATLTMSANYWKNVQPNVSEKWVRNNITKNMDNYVNKYIIQNQFGFDVRYLSFFENKIPENINDKILDIGCSFGIGTEYLKKHYVDAFVTGIDLSPFFLAIASFRNNITNNNIQYIHANAEMLPFSNNSYDKIFIQYLFHELPQHATKQVINEAYRVLKPGGIIAIIDLNPMNLNEKLSINIFRKWAFEVTEPHIFDYYNTNIQELLEANNFRNIDNKINDPFNILYFGQK